MPPLRCWSKALVGGREKQRIFPQRSVVTLGVYSTSELNPNLRSNPVTSDSECEIWPAEPWWLMDKWSHLFMVFWHLSGPAVGHSSCSWTPKLKKKKLRMMESGAKTEWCRGLSLQLFFIMLHWTDARKDNSLSSLGYLRFRVQLRDTGTSGCIGTRILWVRDERFPRFLWFHTQVINSARCRQMLQWATVPYFTRLQG